MKRGWLLTSGLVLVLAAALTAIAAEQEMKKGEEMSKGMVKGKEVTMTGDFSCAFCKMAQPKHTCSPECCATCSKAGSPQVLTDAKGNMYLLMSGDMKQPFMTEERMKLLGGKVKVKGMLVKAKGLQAIYVESMEKAEDMPMMEKSGEMKSEKEKAGEEK